MLYVLRIIGIFENLKSATVAELKTMLDFSIEDCFPFGILKVNSIFAKHKLTIFSLGYPNLSTLLQDFSDIFISSDDIGNTLTDFSVIRINSECISKFRENKIPIY